MARKDSENQKRYLAHVLVKAGNDVTILAREERAKSLDRNGLVISAKDRGRTTQEHSISLSACTASWRSSPAKAPRPVGAD